MNKLFHFARAKGKWHKFPSFNLGGGAKLYKNFTQKLLAVLLCVAVVLLCTPVTTYIASAEDPSPITIKYGSVPVSSVALLAERSVSLSAVGSGITWSSNDTSIVSVNNGRLTAGGSGRATVSVTAAGGYGYGSVSVYVYSGEKIFDGVKYATLEYLDNGETVREAMVAGFTDSLPSVLTLPSSVTLDGAVYSVTAVREKAFWNCDRLTSIVLPDSVRFIGASTFLDCDRLASVTLPDTLDVVSDSLFASCEALRSVSLPASVTAVGDSAFTSCLNLTSVGLPQALRSIGNGSFSGCPKLATVTLSPSVSSVGSWAFGDCSALSRLFYSQGLDLTTAAVPAAANQLAYTVTDVTSSPVKVEISGVTLGLGTTSVSLCPYAMGEGYKITSVASGVTGGSVLADHSWQAATCTNPKTCLVCGTSEGGADPNAHEFATAVVYEPTDQTLGVESRCCSRCFAVDASWCTIKDGSLPTMYPDGTSISASQLTASASSTFDLNGQELTMILQDPLGVLISGAVGLAVTQIELPANFDGDVDVEHAHAYEIVPTIDGVERSGQLNGKVRLLYKIPHGWDRDDLEVFLAQAGQDRAFDETTEKIGDDEYLVVWTDHFSPYVFVDKLNPEEKAALETMQLPDASDGNVLKSQNGSDKGQANSTHSANTGDTRGEFLVLSTLSMIAMGLYLGLFLRKKKSF